MDFALRRIGSALARWLSRPRGSATRTPAPPLDRLAQSLQPGDVVLVEGTSRISEGIKYLTQSTWSHAALYIGNALDKPDTEAPRVLLEADLNEGVRAVPLAVYEGEHLRICRPVGLQPAERNAVIAYAVARLGLQYDLRNIVDLARYLISHPPVPRDIRRRMVALGSGDPTRAICSSLIAQAFQSVGYPILPYVDLDGESACSSPQCYAELLRIRHHSLFTPRDFDISPYFEVIKPTLVEGFEHHRLRWAAQADATSVRMQAGASGAGT